jgi:hypothetical protein
MAQIQVCAECGLAQPDWKGNAGQGYSLEGELYCCQECAEDTGCICNTEPSTPQQHPEPGSAQWGEN